MWYVIRVDRYMMIQCTLQPGLAEQRLQFTIYREGSSACNNAVNTPQITDNCVNDSKPKVVAGLIAQVFLHKHFGM